MGRGAAVDQAKATLDRAKAAADRDQAVGGQEQRQHLPWPEPVPGLADDEQATGRWATSTRPVAVLPSAQHRSCLACRTVELVPCR